jgi:hypothetical protein
MMTIPRRSFLTALAGLAASSPYRRPRFYALESFRSKNLDQVPAGTIMTLEAQIGPHLPEILTVSAFSSQAPARNLTLLEALEVRNPGKSRLFELRVYHSPSPAVHQRLASIFTRAGIHPVISARTIAGAHPPGLTYLTPFDSLIARQKAWDAVNADPDWVRVRHTVSPAHIAIYRVVDRET